MCAGIAQDNQKSSEIMACAARAQHKITAKDLAAYEKHLPFWGSSCYLPQPRLLRQQGCVEYRKKNCTHLFTPDFHTQHNAFHLRQLSIWEVGAFSMLALALCCGYWPSSSCHRPCTTLWRLPPAIRISWKLLEEKIPGVHHAFDEVGGIPVVISWYHTGRFTCGIAMSAAYWAQGVVVWDIIFISGAFWQIGWVLVQLKKTPH